jgi:hypothetical protein
MIRRSRPPLIRIHQSDMPLSDTRPSENTASISRRPSVKATSPREVTPSALTPFSLAAKALALRLFPGKFKRRKRELCVQRFHLALASKDFPQAERILTHFAAHQCPTLDLVSDYIRQVVETGHASNPEALANAAALHPDYRPLVRASVLQREGKSVEALTLLQAGASSFEIRHLMAVARLGIHQELRNHDALAADGMAFLDAEKKDVLIRFAIKVAVAAEAAGNEDLLGRALSRIVGDRDRVLKNPTLLEKFWKDAEIGSVAVFDIAGALEVLLTAKSLKISRVKDPLIDLLLMRERIRPLMPVMAAAHRDLLRRAGLLDGPEPPGEVALVVPASGFKMSREISYKGFRDDIRFVTQTIFETLEEAGVRFVVRGQVGTHHESPLPIPAFSYHTISQQPSGLHFKETDRPSHFSFDRRGYSGWSEFSHRTLAELDLPRIDPVMAAAFFEQEQKSVIASNLSKYAQADLLHQDPLPESYVFVALQKIGDAVQALAYATPFEMLEEVIATCGKLGLAVVVKRHPMCKSPQISEYLRTHSAAGRIVVATGSIHNLIAKAQAVCVVNSGVGAEALLHEKPVYVFGRSDYMAACYVCKEPGDFAARFVPGKLSVSADELRRFWWILRNEYAVDLTDRPAARDWIKRRVRQHLNEVAKGADSPASNGQSSE